MVDGPPKHQFFLLERHDISQKTTSFIITTVKNIPEDRGLQYYMVFLYGETSQDTFDEATAQQ
jgi:hypothetical protein